MIGTAILKNAPMIGAIFAERISLAASTRWTTRKSVVQYPVAFTAPRPNTIPPSSSPSGYLESVRVVSMGG